eukprot:TRINITY_DN10740_c0_g1_i1.p1 TRINITY_DN10740_c0_g1~~TRINITY_DN10740_c0_g1_i1.p1  ORF type:complete len:385 (+),score=55.14 TRINITY_DN10740_c0_g1_i1:31-1185(+)
MYPVASGHQEPAVDDGPHSNLSMTDIRSAAHLVSPLSSLGRQQYQTAVPQFGPAAPVTPNQPVPSVVSAPAQVRAMEVPKPEFPPQGWAFLPFLFIFYVFENVITILDCILVVRKEENWNNRWSPHGRNAFVVFLSLGLLGFVTVGSSFLLWAYKYAASTASRIKHTAQGIIFIYLTLDLPMFILIVWFYWAFDFETGLQRLDLVVKAIAWIAGSFVLWVAWMEKWTEYLHPKFGPELPELLGVTTSPASRRYLVPPQAAIPSEVFREWSLLQTPASLLPSLRPSPLPKQEISPSKPLDLAPAKLNDEALQNTGGATGGFSIADLGLSPTGETTLRSNGLIVPTDFAPLLAFAQSEGLGLHQVLQRDVGLSAVDAIRVTTALSG